MDFSKMDNGTLMSGVNSEGVRYLQLFLTEYTKLTGEKVNPGCNKCMSSYLTKYKEKMSKKSLNQNNSGYRLHAKYENIPLEFGSPILVNNGNLTDEYAKKLLKHKNGERYFAAIPEKEPEEVTEESLKAKVVAAEKKLKNLPKDASAKKRTYAENAVTNAKEALQAFIDESKAANEIEVKTEPSESGDDADIAAEETQE